MNKKDIDELKIRKKIGSNIEYWRKQKGFTQSQVASLLDVSNRTVSNYENGLGIDAVLLYSLSILFGCNIQDFFMEM